MTIREIERLFVYWRRWPHPARVAVWQLQATTTWKQPEKEKPFKESTADELRAFAAAWAFAMG